MTNKYLITLKKKNKYLNYHFLPKKKKKKVSYQLRIEGHKKQNLKTDKLKSIEDNFYKRKVVSVPK